MQRKKSKNSKKSQIRNELIQQSAVLALLTTIAVWQNHFVIQAASADIYIFALLFGAGLFGIYNTVRGTVTLGNDFVALDAIKEVHEDIRRKAIAPQDNIIIVQNRMLSPPIPYDSPKSLGTAHNLILEEMWRTGSLRISPQTMQVLVHDLEAKLDARKEMAHYLGALMVLLGLLGTFIGLMHTLESVGGILGSLDLSGNAGAGAIGGLIESLKLPLEGMATGFGASLFGLIGSLMIGILSKFDSNASNRLLHDFESWIRSVVQIEGAQQTKADDGTVTIAADLEPNEKNWRLMFQVARATVLSTSKMATQIEQLSRNVEKLREHSAMGDTVVQDGLSKLSHEMQRMITAQSTAGIGIESVNSGLADTRERVGNQLSQMTQFLEYSMQHLVTEQAAAGNGIETLKNGLTDTRDRVSGQLAQLAQFLESSSIQSVDSTKQVQNDLANMRETVTQSAESTANTYHLLQYVEQRLAAIQTEKSDNALQLAARKEADELVANLDHLISASRLNPADIARLRHLSTVLEDMVSDEPREKAREAILETVKGVAQ